MMYLVNCEVVKSYYMQDDNEVKEHNHIVEADNEEEAINKVRNYYSLKHSDYYVTHFVNFNYCNELIR